MFKYDPTTNNFVQFESVETPKLNIQLPVMPEPIDLTDYEFSRVDEETQTPIARDTFNITSSNNHVDNPYIPRNNEFVEQEVVNPTTSAKVKISKGSETLSKLIDEVANEYGYEGLKNNHIKKLLMLQAQRESGFDPKAKADGSTASGYFQFIDGTRKQYSQVSKQQFMNDPKEQIRTAYKYLNWIYSTPYAKKLQNKGYNDAQITALGWWYPDSMRMVLNGQKNFSKGGYSIKKALETYK